MFENIEIMQAKDLNHPRMFLILFCLSLALQIIFNFRKQLRYFESRPAGIYGKPPLLLGKFGLPALSRNQFIAAGVFLIASLLSAACNFYPQLFILTALVCYFLYFNPIMPLSYIKRKTNLIPLVLLILLATPAIGFPLNHPAENLSIILVKIVIAQMYLSAGLQKIRRAGIVWADGESLRTFLIEHYLWGDTKPALALAEAPRLCRFLSRLILFFEFTFWIIILLPQLTYFYVALGLLMHLGILYTMRINYIKYLTPAYMVFFTDLAFQIKSGLKI